VPRISPQTLKLIRLFLDDPENEWYGFDIVDRTGLKSGTIYPILSRLEHAGWLESHWEILDPVTAGRPRRRLYRLTREGAICAQAEAEARLNSPPRRLDAPSPRLGGAAA
jgi:PadR family transcriptional regulator PadR